MTTDTRSSRRFRRPTLAVAVLALLAVLAACGGASEPATSSVSDAAATASAATETSAAVDTSAAATASAVETAELPEKITIGYQLIPNGDLAVKNKGWLEAALPGVVIEWKQFDSGGSVNEAFLAGALDIGLAGSSPVSRGLSNDIPYVVPWIHDVIGEAEALVAVEGITTVADLKGKKIATPFASTAHYSLLAALQAEGLSDTDVELIDAEPADILSAWQGGNLDAAYVWNPVLAELVTAGGTVLVDSAQLAETGTTTYDLAVASKEFAEAYPAVLTTWVAEQSRAVELYRSSPQEWAEAVGTELDLEPAEVLDQAGDLIFLTAAEQTGADYLTGGLAKNLFATATFNLEQGQIDAVQDEAFYADAVIATFAESAAG